MDIRLTNLEVDVKEIKTDMGEMKQTINEGFGRMDLFLKHLDDLKSDSAAQIIINSRVDARLGKLEHKVFAK